MSTFQRWAMALGALAIPAAFAAGPVAFITDMKGEVMLDGAPRPMLLSEISAGQTLSVPHGAQASILFAASGREFVLAGPGEFVVKAAEVAAKTGSPPTVRTGTWRGDSRAVAQVAQTAAASVRMRSGATANATSVPREAAVIDRPALSALQMRQPADDAPFSDRLMHGVALYEAGAVQQARDWWSRLAKERGDLPELEALAR